MQKGFRFQVSENSLDGFWSILDMHRKDGHDQYEIAATETSRARARVKARELNRDWSFRIKDSGEDILFESR